MAEKDYDICYECGAYGDDYMENENGELVCRCDTCPFSGYEEEIECD